MTLNKVIIPTTLMATILVAGIFAFMPIEQASSVHTTILAGTVGLACVVETFTLPATFDGDTMTLTFTNEGTNIYITTLTGELTTAANGASTDMGITTTTIDGAVSALVLDDADANGAIGPTELEVFSGADDHNGGYFVQSTMDWVIDDNAGGAATAVNDVLSLEICGYVSDPANFGNEDTAITNVPA